MSFIINHIKDAVLPDSDISFKLRQGGEALGIKGYLFDGDAGKLREFINNEPNMAYRI